MEQSRSCASSHPRAWVVDVVMDVDHLLFIGCSCDERRGGVPRIPPAHVRLYARFGKYAGFPALSKQLGVLDSERFHLLRWEAEDL